MDRPPAKRPIPTNTVPSRAPAESGAVGHGMAAPAAWPLGAATAGGAATPPGTIKWRRSLASLRRYKWLVAALFLLTVGAGVFASRVLKPQYVAHATIWIAPETRRDVNAGPIRGEDVLHRAAWPELLTSFAILETVARSMTLYFAPANPADSLVFAGLTADDRFRTGAYELTVGEGGNRYVLSAVDGPRLEAGVMGDSVGRAIGLRWAPPAGVLEPGRRVRFTLLSPREAALSLRQRLTTSLPEGSNLLRVTLSGTDPQRVATLLSAIVDEFEATAASLKNRNVTQLAGTLQQQLDIAAAELREAEAALQEFRIRTITLPMESPSSGESNGQAGSRDPVFQGYASQQMAFESARQERLMLEQTVSAIGQGRLEMGALSSLPSVRAGAPELQAALDDMVSIESRLRAARRQFTDEHPTVRSLVQDLEALRDRTIPHQAAALGRQLAMREAALDAQVRSVSQQLRGIPARTTEEMRLRRNVETRADLYATLKSRHAEVSLAEASAMPDISILDQPVAPERPSRDRAPFVLVLAALVGMVGSVGVALTLDRMDSRFRYPEQASEELGLDIIGAVPAISEPRQGTHDPGAATQILEAFRAIRLNLSHASDVSGRVVLAISSPNAGDGKSMIAANLAQSFVDAGYRTLLVDGDIHRGELHSRFSVDRGPGLLDYLGGTAALDEALRTTSNDGLCLLPRGTPHTRGSELLMSAAMPDLITELQRRFEAVVVDSPPLGAGVDPFVLSTATGNLLLVLRAGESDRRLAEAKLKLLERLPIRVLGVVLNDFHAAGAYQYYAYLYADRNEETWGPELESQLADFARRSGLVSLRR